MPTVACWDIISVCFAALPTESRVDHMTVSRLNRLRGTLGDRSCPGSIQHDCNHPNVQSSTQRSIYRIKGFIQIDQLYQFWNWTVHFSLYPDRPCKNKEKDEMMQPVRTSHIKGSLGVNHLLLNVDADA